MRDSLFAPEMPARLGFPAQAAAPDTTLRTHTRSASTLAKQRFAALQAWLGMPKPGNSNVRKPANDATADA